MAEDAVTLIMNDHRVMEGIFDRLMSGEGDTRTLLIECAARLTAHSHAEEQRVYPALATADPSERDEVHHGADEHHQAEMMLLKLQQLGADSAEFKTALEEFVGAVRHHIEEEETEILPSLRDSVDAAKLEELGAEFERIRIEELQVAGFGPVPAASGRSAGSGSAGSGSAGSGSASSAGARAADTDSMSRDELYEQAKQADIPGRSTMTKDELAEALRSQNGE